MTVSELEGWIEDLQSADWRKALRAEESLVRLGPSAVRSLAQPLQSGTGAAPLGVLRVLVRLGPASLPVLHQALFVASPERRRGAVEAVAEIRDESSIEALTKLLDDSHPLVRAAVLDALLRFGGAAAAHLEAASRMCRPGGRELALRALAGISSPASWAAVRRGMDDLDPGVRIAAARLLAQSGDAELHLAAAAALWDANPAVRSEAASALVSAGDGCVARLYQALETEPREQRERAAFALVDCLAVPGIPELLPRLVSEDVLRPHLIRHLQADEPLIRRAAHRLLKRSADAPYSQLAELLKHPEGEVRELAVDLLAGGGEAVVKLLLQHVPQSGSAARAAAMEVLVRIGEPAVDPLLNAVQRHGGGLQRLEMETLGRIGNAAAARVLIALLQDGTNCLACAGALRVMAERDSAPPELRAALPILKRRLAPWAFSSQQETEAYQEALRAIEEATRRMKDLPLPSAGTEPTRGSLPIPGPDVTGS